MKRIVGVVAAVALAGMLALAPAQAVSTSASAPLTIDRDGVMRWRADGAEVRLFGANYCAFASGDYRLAKRIGADMAHFARMGWDGMRLCSWGDWESSDAKGNLVQDEHTRLMDYLIAKARERGISMLLSPIVTYGSAYADQMGNPDYQPAGLSSKVERKAMGLDTGAIAAQVNYIRQSLNHVNPYTGLALKDDPAILFVEMINEPVHHPENLAQSIAYINTLHDAVRSTGSRQITFHNYSQDFAIGDALAASKVQGIDFGWYPSGLVSGRTLKGNFLQAVDAYPAMLNPRLAARPRIVYEFDQGDLNTGYLYPAMARTFRSVGTQFAAIFAYDMLDTAPYNLSWQTHFINLVHTPRKAVSAVIAGEAMRRLPRMQGYGAYPENREFGDFKVSYEDDASELNAPDAFMYAGDTASAPRQIASMTRLVGFGSSPVVAYHGTGAYFLDKVSDGVWRLELYPHALLVSDPFAQPSPDKIVSRLYFNALPMALQLPNLGGAFTATPLTLPANPTARAQQAVNGRFDVEPGVWLLSRSGPVDVSTLPAKAGRVGMREYHVNAPQVYPDLILNASAAEYVAGAPVTIRVNVASQQIPESVAVYVRPAGAREFGKPLALHRTGQFDYRADVDALAEGHYEFVVVESGAGVATTFPGSVTGQPGRWPFEARDVWRFTVTSAQRPLEIFNPARDISGMSFVRTSEEERAPMFKLVPGESSSDTAFALALPRTASAPARYAGALYIGDRVAARGAAAANASALSVRLKARDGKRKTLELFLIEKDGSSWRAAVVAGAQWSTASIALDKLTFAPSVLTPTPFPGDWNYWRHAPAARAHSKIAPQNIERLELRASRTEDDDADGVEIESVQLHFPTR